MAKVVKFKMKKMDKIILANMAAKTDRSHYNSMLIEAENFAEESKSRRKTTVETTAEPSANSAPELA